MSDIPLLVEILSQTLSCIARIERRFQGIDCPEDFLADNEGIDRLDGIGMMLISIGENLKKFEASGGRLFLDKHPEIDWKGVKGIRDFLSHHYFDLDVEVVFETCKSRIEPLKQALGSIRSELLNL